MKKVFVDDKKFEELENAFKEIQKQGRENEKKLEQEPLYIDYFGEIIPLREAVDRFIKNGVPKHKNLTKKTKNSIRD